MNFLEKSAKLPVVFLGIILLISGVCQSAPGRQEKWNPYYYPTVRSIVAVSALSRRPSIIPKISYVTPVAPLPRLIPIPVPTFTTTINQRFKKSKLSKGASKRSSNRREIQPINDFSSLLVTPVPNNSSQKFLGIDIENFDVGNSTAIALALNEFLRSGEHVIREVLMYSQNELLRMIGQVDQGTDRLQKRLQDSSFRLTLAGQKAAAVTFKSLPPILNKLLQRITTPMDSPSGKSLNVQLNEAIQNLRQLKKMLFEALEEHEKDFHDVFQDRFTQINQYLGVAELPRRPLAWFS